MLLILSCVRIRLQAEFQCLFKKKRPVVSYGRPLNILDSYPHGLSTHDFLDPELRHHHALDTNAVIIILFFYFLLNFPTDVTF